MFTYLMIKKNIVRHWKRNLLAILISMMLALFLLIYINNIELNKLHLSKLGETLLVTGRVSNMDGSQETGLIIDFDKVDKIINTGLVDDVVITSQTYGMLAGTAEEEKQYGPQINMVGTNTLSAFSDISATDISFQGNYDESFLQGNKFLCIVNDTLTDEQGTSLGGELELEVYAPKYEVKSGELYTYEELRVMKCKVIGTYSIQSIDSSVEIPDMLIPIRSMESIYLESGVIPTASSMKFTLSQPFQMNEFKSIMKDIGFYSVSLSGSSSNEGKALIMNDQIFILAATQLKENLALMQGLAPLIYFIITVIGLISSYILMQSRQEEFAIMRSLGTGSMRTFFIILLESVILAVLGILLGTFAGGIIIKAFKPEIMGIVLFIFLIFYILGTAIALLLLNRFSVMKILSKTD